MMDTAELMDAGFACLIEKLGVVDTEHFISTINREQFDYTTWRRNYFDEMSLDQINNEAVSYAKNHEHKGKGIRI